MIFFHFMYTQIRDTAKIQILILEVWVGPDTLHFYQVPKWYQWSWLAGHPLSSTERDSSGKMTEKIWVPMCPYRGKLFHCPGSLIWKLLSEREINLYVFKLLLFLFSILHAIAISVHFNSHIWLQTSSFFMIQDGDWNTSHHVCILYWHQETGKQSGCLFPRRLPESPTKYSLCILLFRA